MNPETGARSTESDDVDAYDLILKHKAQLLSFEEPVRFIFSHSALREGWDNPNVFVICMLKHSDNTSPAGRRSVAACDFPSTSTATAWMIPRLCTS